NEDGNGHESRDGGRNGSGNENKNIRKSRGSEGPLTYVVMVEVGRKTREGGRHQRVTRSQSHKTRRPSKTIAPHKGPECMDGRRGTGLGRAEEGRSGAGTDTGTGSGSGTGT
ncbi:unnamed protein product, partial [Ascophyllum nodosum]